VFFKAQSTQIAIIYTHVIEPLLKRHHAQILIRLFIVYLFLDFRVPCERVVEFRHIELLSFTSLIQLSRMSSIAGSLTSSMVFVLLRTVLPVLASLLSFTPLFLAILLILFGVKFKKHNSERFILQNERLLLNEI
jgi:hypothetical protein